MGFRKILAKIQPLNKNEEVFYSSLLNCKSAVLDQRALTYSFLSENTTYPEASLLASSAMSWVESLQILYEKFESRKQNYEKICVDSARFLDFCKSKGWSAKENSKEIVARNEKEFKAIYEFSSKFAYIKFSSESSLEKVKFLNELMGAS